MVFPEMFTAFWILTSVFFCPGVRRPGSVLGAFPNVNAGAAVKAAALIQAFNRSSVLPAVARSIPSTMLGR